MISPPDSINVALLWWVFVFACINLTFIGLFVNPRLSSERISDTCATLSCLSGNDGLFLVSPHPKLIVNTEYICLAHIRLWNWQSACSGHLNRAGLRELTGQGRASYLWTWKSNCIFFSLRILLRDSDSSNPRKTVLLYGRGAGAAHGLLNLCVPKGDHQLPLSCKFRHGLRPPAKPSFITIFFCCCCGEPPWCRLASPHLLFSVRQT